jgi:steroid delta-isomerase-like uncharacterized protein
MRRGRVGVGGGVMVAALGLMAMMPSGMGAGQATPMVEEQVVMETVEMPALLDGYVAALNAHDAEAVAAAYAEDAVVTQAVQDGGTFTGRAEIAGWVRDNVAGLPDLEVGVVSVVQDADRLVWEWVYTGSYTGQYPGAPGGAGQAIELRGVSVMEVQDGVVVRETLYFDNLAFLTQIGALDAGTPVAG